MATTRATAEEFVNRLGGLDVRVRAMFGEYALYCDDKVVALLCDERMFLKNTAAAEGLPFELGQPFPGAKDHLIVDDGFMRDARAFEELVQNTADLLPKPRPKKKASASARTTRRVSPSASQRAPKGGDR